MSEITIGELCRLLLPDISDSAPVPSWPPDAFAVCATILQRGAGYAKALTDWPSSLYYSCSDDGGRWCETARSVGLEWRTAVVEGGTLPAQVQANWDTVRAQFGSGLTSVHSDISLCRAILELCAFADEASAGVGSAIPTANNRVDRLFLQWANRELLGRWDESFGATLCRAVHPSRARVLPKAHTPQSGLTLRSLTHYLALCNATDVIPHWRNVPMSINDQDIKLLIVPWPSEVRADSFREAEHGDDMKNMPSSFGFFTVEGADSADPVAYVNDVYDAALRVCSRIDGVIMPELSMSSKHYASLRRQELGESFLMCGYGNCAKNGKPGENRVGLEFGYRLKSGDWEWQGKHHRWQISGWQIGQYGLADFLEEDRRWWEFVAVDDRRFFFYSISPDLVVSALICEDLARPDPVPDLIRAVGPNLVVALLMDGPQIQQRWSARYATVLADDPGCSVLSVTSTGMSALSKPRDPAKARPGCIALWKDAKNDPVEIQLEPGADAVVLNLKTEFAEEWTADGRGDNGAAAFLLLESQQMIHLPKGSAVK